MRCLHCGGDNRDDQRFCSRCGARLDLTCPSCGRSVEPDDRFCGGCGAPLTGAGANSPGQTARWAPATPETEVRLVSILFLDLVDFTELSDGRDPEEIRELLDAYFARARQTVERYGGAVEKFIGDAVMAVWGTPVAHDDDAERAVRAALDLVAEVPVIGAEAELDDLRARAGIATGRVAATVGAEHQAMVAGDRVNTAARLQSLAAPGNVFVDEATWRATSTSIAYDDVGLLDVAGKRDRAHAWRAVRVVARRGGTIGTAGLEPAFVGRERELRLVKSLFETVTEQRSASIVAMIGQAGVGKSRLTWEFEKHLDGLVERVYWHRGRCPAYGEGIAYNALADMVRSRVDIAEQDDLDLARQKLDEHIHHLVPDPDERDFILPRLAHLLGLESHPAVEQADLFSAWRLFFERLAAEHPVVLLFEDLQWSEPALLDFIDHLLDWARDAPIFVLALARPEFVERADWGVRFRNLTTIHLEPLDPAAMESIVTGLLPGASGQLRARIVDKAAGVPLYAVETVRMLLDRSHVDGDGHPELPGGVDDLDIPETLHSLIAARLDALEPDERDTLQHAAVVGHTFTRQDLVVMTGLDPALVDRHLLSLRTRELIGLHAGTGGGRYAFLQSVVRTIAYEMLSRREKRARHLAVARHLREQDRTDELAEVVASHYLDAYRADKDADDAEEIRADALRMLERAAERAESLAALGEAQRCCEAVVEIEVDPSRRAEALLRAGDLARRGGRTGEASAHLGAAAEAFAVLGDTRREALAQAELARIDFDEGNAHEAVERLASAVERLDLDEMPVEYARLAAELARQLYFVGRTDEAFANVEGALERAERQRLVDVLCDALNTKALMMTERGRTEEGLGLLKHAYDLADDVPSYVAYRAANNLMTSLTQRARWDEARELADRGLQRARRDGNRLGELMVLLGLAAVAYHTGRWDDAVAHLAEAETAGERSRVARAAIDRSHLMLLLRRGQLEEAEELLDELEDRGPADEQERLNNGLARVLFLREAGRHPDAVSEALRLTAEPTSMGTRLAQVGVAIASAVEIGDLDAARTLRARAAELADPSDEVTAAELQLSDAVIAAADDDPAAEELLRAAVSAFDRIGAPPGRAEAELQLARWLIEASRHDEALALIDQAESLLRNLGARPGVERARQLREHMATLERVQA